MKQIAIILFCIVLLSACGPHIPIPIKPPPVEPQPIEPWLRMARNACGEGATVPATPRIVDTWNVAITADLLAKTVAVADGIEVGLHLDVHWFDPDTSTVQDFWHYLNEQRAWTCWGPPNKAIYKDCHTWACPTYSLADQLRAAHYCGLWIELNIDTSGAWTFDGDKWCGNYHYGRENPVLADDGKVARFTVKLIRALEQYAGFVPNAVFIENEPLCCSTRVQEFTPETYFGRVERIGAAIQRKWPKILIGAGGVEPGLGIAAYKRGIADYVGAHAVYVDRAEYVRLRQAFVNAGVPLGMVVFDECVDRDGPVMAIEETLDKGVRSLHWTTIAAPRKAVSWSETGRGTYGRFKREVEHEQP